MRGAARSLAVTLPLLAFACGGATAPVPDPSSSSSGASGSSTSSGGASSSSGGASSSGARACTELGCANGFDVVFSYNVQGSYVVTLKLDDTQVVCKASIPLRPADRTCDRADVYLTTVGSALPVAQQSIGGIHVVSTTAERLSVEVARDGSVLASGAWAPIPYETRPGPNGPGCEPATCTSGSVTLLER